MITGDEEAPKPVGDIKSPKHLFCQHHFLDLMEREKTKRQGEEIWFYCCACLVMVKKILKDESQLL